MNGNTLLKRVLDNDIEYEFNGYAQPGEIEQILRYIKLTFKDRVAWVNEHPHIFEQKESLPTHFPDENLLLVTGDQMPISVGTTTVGEVVVFYNQETDKIQLGEKPIAYPGYRNGPLKSAFEVNGIVFANYFAANGQILDDKFSELFHSSTQYSVSHNVGVQNRMNVFAEESIGFCQTSLPCSFWEDDKEIIVVPAYTVDDEPELFNYTYLGDTSGPVWRWMCMSFSEYIKSDCTCEDFFISQYSGKLILECYDGTESFNESLIARLTKVGNDA